MEPQAAVKIVQDLAMSKNNIYLENIVIDDDTTTMAQLRNIRNGGKLDNDIIPPKKWGDLGHRIRGLGRQMQELSEMSKTKTRVNK